MKVRVQNFQSIADSTVEVKGLTVISGSNNCGKSAVIRAIEGVFINKGGHSFVRHGADHSTVTIDVDGRQIIWKKGKKINQYIIDGKVFDKVGSSPPDELKEFKIHAIKAGNQELWPQVAPQFTGQVFLLDQSGSTIAEAVTDVERVGVLNKALKLCDSDRRSNNSTLKVRRGDLQKVESDLEVYEGLDAVLLQVEELDREFESLKTQTVKLRKMQDVQARLLRQKEVFTRLESASDLECPDTSKLQKTFDLLTDLRKKKSKFEKLNQVLSNLESVMSLKSNTDVQPLSDLIEERNRLKILHQRYQNIAAEAPVRQAEMDKLKNELNEVNQALAEFKTCPLCGSSNENHHHS